MPITITPIYAALTAFVFLALSWRVISYRLAQHVTIGDAGDRDLLKRIRAQGNCAEYGPIALLLVLMMELSGAPAIAIHLAGATVVLGRLLHAIGFGSSPQIILFRRLGVGLTFLVIALTALGLLAHSLL